MGGQEIGALFVKIGADVNGLKTGLAEGSKHVKTFEQKVNSAVLSMAKFGAVLAGIGAAAIVGGLVAGTIAAANFQTQLTQLKTGAGETDAGLKIVSKGILDMAGKVGQSASSLAAGMFMIESAGFHGAAGLKVLEAAAEGAKVGNADLATVADAVTTVLADYHMGADKAADATNFLVAVVKQGKTHMEDLAGSLAHVLPFAAALHIPLEQIGGAMATMTAKGIPAADAATYLRFTMAALANETPKGAKALKEIGLTTEEVANTLQTKGLLPALELIQTQLAKKFPKGGAAYFAALSNIVGGTRGLGAALQLTGVNLNDFIHATATVADQIKNGKGQVLGWSDVQKDFNFQIQAGQAGLEAAGIKIGTKLLPPLTEFAKQIIPLIPKIADMGSAFLDKVLPGVEGFAKWLITLGPELKKGYDIFSTLAPYILAIAAAWTLWNIGLGITKALNFATMAVQFVAGLIAIVQKVGFATAAQWLWNIAMDANPIGIVLIGLAALAAAFVWAYQNIPPFRNFVNALWGDLQAFGQWMAQVFGPLMSGIGKLLGDIGRGNWGAVPGDLAALHFGNFVGTVNAGPRTGTDAAVHGKVRAFATGGIVPGGIGAPMFAVVHGGERVLTPSQQKAGGDSTGGGTTTYVYPTPIRIGNPHDLLAALYTLIQEAQYARGRGSSGSYQGV